MTDREAFEKIDSWLEQIQDNAPPDTAVILVANKSDLDYEREVSKEEGLQLASSKNLPFFETSAKAGTDVKEAFTYVIETAYAKKKGVAVPSLVQRNPSFKMAGSGAEKEGYVQPKYEEPARKQSLKLTRESHLEKKKVKSEKSGCC